MTLNDPRRDTANQVERLWAMGWPVRRIARSLDISTQRVNQILKDRNLRNDKENASLSKTTALVKTTIICEVCLCEGATYFSQGYYGETWRCTKGCGVKFLRAKP